MKVDHSFGNALNQLKWCLSIKAPIFLVEPNKVRKVDSLVGQVLDMLIVTSNALDEYLLSSPAIYR